MPTGATTSVVATDPTASGSTTTPEVPSGTPGMTPTTPKTATAPGPTGTGTGTTPGVDPKKDAACKTAMGLAQPGNIQLAVNAYRNCDGPSKQAAASKIGSAAMTSAGRGCSGLADAKAAASIGQGGALKVLRDRKCKGA